MQSTFSSYILEADQIITKNEKRFLKMLDVNAVKVYYAGMMFKKVSALRDRIDDPG